MRGSLTIISRISEATDCVSHEENKIGLGSHCSFIFSLGILLSRAAWWAETQRHRLHASVRKQNRSF